jgi:hypothetical protein
MGRITVWVGILSTACVTAKESSRSSSQDSVVSLARDTGNALGVSRAQRDTMPPWRVDSTEDHIEAELKSSKGQFAASFDLRCYPRSPVEAYRGPLLQMWVLGVFPRIGYDKGPNAPSDRVPVTRMTLRFDTTEVREVQFVVGDGGESDSRSLGPNKLLWSTDTVSKGWFQDMASARDTLLRRLRDAHRLLIALPLSTNQTATAEFAFGPDTRTVIERVYGVCKKALP